MSEAKATDVYTHEEVQLMLLAQQKRWQLAARMVIEATPEQLPLAIDLLSDMVLEGQTLDVTVARRG